MTHASKINEIMHAAITREQMVAALVRYVCVACGDSFDAGWEDGATWGKRQVKS